MAKSAVSLICAAVIACELSACTTSGHPASVAVSATSTTTVPLSPPSSSVATLATSTVPSTSKRDATTTTSPGATTTTPDTVYGITATCPQPYAATASATGSTPPYGLHVTWQVYTTDAGKAYTVTLYQYRTYQDADHVMSTLTADKTEADFSGLLTDGWLYRVEVTVPGVNDGSALREACVDLDTSKPTTAP